MLCGALANEYDAQLVDSIDTRITNRAVVIAGGIGRTAGGTHSNRMQLPLYSEFSDGEQNSALFVASTSDQGDFALAVKRGRMPKLLRS